jgi:hypothetical protein
MVATSLLAALSVGQEQISCDLTKDDLEKLARAGYTNCRSIELSAESWNQFVWNDWTTSTWDPWLQIDPTYCGVYDSPCPAPFTYVAGQQSATQICWSLTGSIELEAGLGLLAQALARVNGTVQIGTQLSGCKTVGEEYSISATTSACWLGAVRTGETTAHTSLSVRTSRYITVQCDGESLKTPCTSEEVVLATASRLDSRGLQVAPGRCDQNAPGPGQPDPYDGKRREPCCLPLAPCSEEQPPCCACRGNH